MKSVLILIPTYNESENIENLLSRLVAARIYLSKNYGKLSKMSFLFLI
jgi:glycosyltransferase involved in cell wall biosynthesis